MNLYLLQRLFSEGKEKNMKIILASQSPRRRDLLEQIGLDFAVLVSEVEERITEKDPEAAVCQLALQKAKAVAEQQEPGTLVIGADTVVVSEGRIMGKPKNGEEARRMLRQLQGSTHSVFTGTALICTGEIQDETEVFARETKVSMYPMTEEEIAWYISTGEPMDKAGAYGIQGICARFIEKIEGDYNNVVGLPVGEIYQRIKMKSL